MNFEYGSLHSDEPCCRTRMFPFSEKFPRSICGVRDQFEKMRSLLAYIGTGRNSGLERKWHGYLEWTEAKMQIPNIWPGQVQHDAMAKLETKMSEISNFYSGSHLTVTYNGLHFHKIVRFCLRNRILSICKSPFSIKIWKYQGVRNSGFSVSRAIYDLSVNLNWNGSGFWPWPPNISWTYIFPFVDTKDPVRVVSILANSI